MSGATRNAAYRTERDSLGEVRVPADALYGPQTQRAVDNFAISGRSMPPAFIEALGILKAAAAQTNAELGHLESRRADAIAVAATAIANGEHRSAFPVDVYQTGSGTSSNMNVNEVVARLAGDSIHPNDHVNLCQSSNDVIPSALQVAVTMETSRQLFPALQHLEKTIAIQADAAKDVVKTGRTHLMDAMPLRLDQELGAWSHSITQARVDLDTALANLLILPLGGTAVGTGVNAHSGFANGVASRLASTTGLPFTTSSGFRNLGSIDAAVAFSGRLNTVATAMLKISNDLRWMNSGPLCGLGEVRLPALQPGSSIMPGKVNPVIPEAVAMAGQSGNFQLNVMLPLVADNLLQAIAMLQRAAVSLADKAIAGLQVNREHLQSELSRNPVLATALNPRIGYERSAEIAREASRRGIPVIDVAAEMTDLPRDELEALLDPRALTFGGMPD